MKNRIYKENFTINFNQEDKKCINDLILALNKGQKDIFEFLEIPFKPINIDVFIYENIEKLHKDLYNIKKDDWNVCDIKEDTIRIVSPLFSSKIHDYQSILLIANKAVQDIVLHKYFGNTPRWLGITILTSRLMSNTKTNSKPRFSRFLNDDYYSNSDSYFIANFLIRKFGKKTVIELLKQPQNYKKALNLLDEEIDKELEEYYCV